MVLLFGLIAGSYLACKDPVSHQDTMFNDQPAFTYPLDTSEGYVFNPVYNDTAYKTSPTYNARGELIPHGKPYLITGKSIHPDRVTTRTISPVKKPVVKPVYTNIRPLTFQTLRRLPVNSTKKQGIEKHKLSHVILNSKGDTIQTNTPMPVAELIADLPVKQFDMEQPSTRYDAIYNIRILDREHGLNLSDVTAVLQDRRGYIWFGLYGGGIECYDGNSKMHFGPKLPDLRLSFVSALFEDRAGNIWISNHGGGVFRYNGTTFTPFRETEGLAGNNINCIAEDASGNIWFGIRGQGACRYQPPSSGKQGTLTHFGPGEGLYGTDVTSILADRKGNLWFGTDKGIYRYQQDGFNGQEVFTSFVMHEGFLPNKVFKMLEDHLGNIWFGTSRGAYYYDLSSGYNAQNILHLKLEPEKPEHVIRTLYEDREGNIWFGTYGGGAFKVKGQSIRVNEKVHSMQFTTSDGLPDNRIHSILEDNTGNIWLGTEGGGVAILGSRSFMHLGESEGFSQDVVNCIFEDREHNIWFGLHGENPLIALPYTTEVHSTAFVKYQLPAYNFQSMAEDVQGDLWIGIRGVGICRFNGKSFTFYNWTDGLPSNDVRSVICDRHGNIWAGTMGGGIICIPSSDNTGDRAPTVIQYTEENGLPEDNVSFVYEDSQGNIWICSAEGLSRFKVTADGTAGIITHFNEKSGLPFKVVISVKEDKRNNIWIGAGGAVSMYASATNENAGTLTHIGPRIFGILKNRTISLLEDKSGNIWRGTPVGLHLVVQGDEPGTVEQVVAFKRSDGLRGSEFRNNSCLLDNRNQAWWGSNSGGVDKLDMNTFSISQQIPQPQLRRLEINEQLYQYNNLSDSLRKEIRFDSVPLFSNIPVNPTMTYTNRHLTFYFAALDWIAPHKIRYSFRMEGLEENWSQPSEINKVEYRGLSHGKYVLKVRAIGESQKWSEPYAYAFTILPPWWFSWWAYLVYGTMVAWMAFMLFRYQLMRRLEMEEKKRLVELDTLKNNLFTNITHEFRTPLTLIHGPLSLALSSHHTLEEKDMQSMYHQSKRLQQLITQILDLQKAEAGKLKPVYTHGDIAEYIRYLFEAYGSFARENGVSLYFSTDPEHIFMDFDEEKTTQIITNLVSNAIRHTPAQGTVSLALREDPTIAKLMISLKDTGVGISQQDLPFVFDRYYQTSHAARGGTGIGLALTKSLVELLKGSITVESEISHGTEIKILLPVTHFNRNAQVVSSGKSKAIPEVYDDEARFSTPADLISDKPIILIVEDHPEVAQFIASGLKKDFSILSAMDGDEGIRKAFEHIPDLVISDVIMPGKNGFELCATLKKDIQTSHIPVILLTGRGDQAALMEGIEQGADAYVVKPFEPAELLLRVKKLLELRISLRKYYRTATATSTEVREVPDNTSPGEHAFLSRIRAFVEEHMNDPQLNMHSLTRHMGMSHPQLHRKITALTGESTGKFVRSVRLAKAIELLKTSDLTVSEIAYETGFSDPGYFTKVFSKEYNMTPTDFRGGAVG